MIKVPVGASIAHAYEFLLGRFFQIIGTVWLPAAIFGAGYYYCLTIVAPMLSVHPGDAAAMAGSLGLVLASIAVFLLIHTVIAISLTQEALGVRKDLTLAHFVIGPRELRLFFAYLRYYLVAILTYAAVLAVSVASTFAARKYGTGLANNLIVGGMPVAVFASLALTAVLVIGFVLSMFRLFFLLAPVSAVEHRTRLSRAWSLSHRSTFRIVIILLCTCVPAIAAAGAVIYFLIGPAEISGLFKTLHDSKAGDHSALFAFFPAHAVVLSSIATVLAVINGALLAGASAHAYRVASGHEDPELEDDAALVAPLLTPAGAKEPAHGHGEPAHGDHDHGGHGHDDHGHGGHGHEEHGHDDHGGHGHGDHGHGGHDDHGHDDHGHGGHGHDDHGHEDHGHEDHGHDDHGHGGHGHDSHATHGHDDHGHGGHGHDDHGHGGHDDHGHGDHGHGHHAHAGDDHRHAA